MFYYEIKLNNTDHESFETLTISVETMQLICEYLKESIFTDGKMPLTDIDRIIISKFLKFHDNTKETRSMYEQSGLD